MLQTALSLRVHLFGRPHLSDAHAPLKFKAPPRALSLLAFLLVQGPAPLVRDVVAFALWPDDIEADARANLRRHLFYLTNDVLPPPAPKTPWILADKRTIAWNPAAPAWCDVRNFARLGADASTAREAAALYRGDLLEGFEDEWLEAPRERLREQQVQLLLGLMNAGRASGDHAAGIAHARQLLAVDPWREDAIRALIDLRNASGDRAGALATYRDFVKRLEAEMGVAPMPETTAEYQRVATSPSTPNERPRAAAAEPAEDRDEKRESAGQADDRAAADAAFVPNPHWHAPDSISNGEAVRPVPSFTGRDDELAQLDTALWDRNGIAAIHGLGGIGKSALAREYARRNRERYAAVWWLHADTEAGIIDGLIRLGSEFVPGLAKVDDRRGAAEHVAANVLRGLTKPVLLIYDNLDDDRLLHAWSPRGGAQLLVTARHAVLGGDIVPVRLGAWKSDETVSYLRREIGRPDVSAADAVLLAETLGSLPLALAHAAAYLKSTINVTVQRYVERINDHLARTPRGADYDRAVFATFRAAIARAEEEAPGAAALLCFAACFAPDAIPEELFHQSAGVYGELVPALAGTSATPLNLRAAIADDIGIEDALGALDRFSLLTFALETRSYTMHRLVQSAARLTLAASDPAWAQSAVATAEAAFPEIEFPRWPNCERLIAHARAALDALPDVACSETAAALALRCGQYLRKRAAFADAEAPLRRGLAIAEACTGSAQSAVVAKHSEALAALLRETNRLAEAEPLHRRAIQVYEATLGPQHARVAAALNDLAILLHYTNRLGEAETLYRRALTIDEAGYGPDHPVVAVRLHNLALVLHETNHCSEAELLLRRALLIDERAHGTMHPDVASDLGNLGWLLFESGRIAEAEPLLRRAMTIREAAFGIHHPSYAHALSDMAVLQHDAGQVAEADRLYHDALEIYEASYGAGHPVVAACFNNVAELLADTGRWGEAEALYARALASDEATYGPSHANVARDLNNFAGLLAATNRAAEASALMRRALSIVTMSYDSDHPRAQTVRDNSALLERAALRTTAAAIGSPRWRNIRRSPSRGLR